MELIEKKSGSFKTSDKCEIYYEVHGKSGPTLILTYGIACLINNWNYQISEFAKNYKVVVYDLRGHHKSSLNSTEVTIERLAKDTLDLMDKLKIESAHLWGHSFGAPISLCAAHLEPKRVESLCFINGFYKNPFELQLDKNQIVGIADKLLEFEESAPDLSRWLWKTLADNHFSRQVAGLVGGFNLERAPYKDIEIYSKGVSNLSIQTFLRHFKALVSFEGYSMLPSIECPTIIFHGDRDGIISLEQSLIFSEEIPNCELIRLKEGSHCSPIDLYHKINTHLHSFLNKQKS